MLSQTEREFFEKSLVKGSLKKHWMLFLTNTMPSNNNFNNWEKLTYIQKSFDYLYEKFIANLAFYEREVKIDEATLISKNEESL